MSCLILVCANTGRDAIVAVDPLRVTVGVQRLGMTGSQVSQKLEQEFAVVAELATQQVALLLLRCGLTTSCFALHGGLLVVHRGMHTTASQAAPAACLPSSSLASIDSGDGVLGNWLSGEVLSCLMDAYLPGWHCTALTIERCSRLAEHQLHLVVAPLSQARTV